MQLDDLHPCPYCNSDDLYLDEYLIDGRHGCCVACHSCGLSGPVSFDGEGIACKAWEALHKKMCRHCMDRLIRANKQLKAELRRLAGEE